jgi:hypothetical protein
MTFKQMMMAGALASAVAVGALIDRAGAQVLTPARRSSDSSR